MARKKKSKSGKKTAEKEEESPWSAHNFFLENCLEEIAELERQGVRLKRADTSTRNGASSDTSEERDPLLNELEKLVSPQEFEILEKCSAFGEMQLDLTPEGRNFIDSKQCQQMAFGAPSASSSTHARLRPPPPPVPIFAEFPGKSSSTALAGGLRYLQTVLHPAEMRWLVAELVCDTLEKAPVTHTDISDAVIASIAPSTAQKVAFQADAQYKYTTAQFLQVYMKMRHVVLEHKLMLGGARADALLLALSPYEFEPLKPEDDVPVSAVEALRQLIDSENMIR